MSSTTAITRRQGADSQPLNTIPALNNRRRSSAHSTASTIPPLALPSPSIVAARAYFLEHVTPIGQWEDAFQWRKSLIEGQQIPRRHSVLATPGSLATRLDNFTFKSGAKSLTSMVETEKVEPEIKVEDEDDCFEAEVNQQEAVDSGQLGSAKEYGALGGSAPEILQRVPFEYTHGRLQGWGYAYLGNTATADAFVNAVSLRRPSLALVKENGRTPLPKSPEIVTIRARVLPKAKERKPFLIQRQFDIKELRATIPAVPKSEGISNEPRLTLSRRSSRCRRSPTQQDHQRRPNLELRGGGKLQSLGVGAVPIHIEYALHFLPVLAALMLSGHVRKGDAIDLPIPHPEAWGSVISFIYTGKVTMTSAMRENILYLAGKVA